MSEICSLENILLTACKSQNIQLNDTMLQQFEQYYKLLIEWNEKINLTAITDKKDVFVKHFADSIYGAKLIPQNATLCDIGTGAGFPAVVLKIVRPDIKVTLVDALEKRIKFLNEVIYNLQLSNISALHNRAEDKEFKEKYLNSFDVVTARAVARMCTLSEYCLPFVKVGGTFLAYKSDKIEDELKESEKAITILGGVTKDVIQYKLDEETTRLIVCVSKTHETKKLYPRDKNRPKKQPIM